MKSLKILATTSLISALVLASAGCAGAETSEAVTSDTESQTTASETTAEATEESVLTELISSHQVSVVDFSEITLTDINGVEYSNVCPKLIVDGEEATEINESLSKYLKETYPIEMNGDYVDGFETSYVWGYNDDTVSIVIFAGYLSEDYYTYEAFNYDLDTLEPLEAGEVTKRLGMTDDELFSKTADILTAYCDGTSYDLDKCIENNNYNNITPFILPDGNAGVTAGIYYSADSQFSGAVSVRCFDMTTMERTTF